MTIDDDVRSALRSLADEAGTGPADRIPAVHRRDRRRRAGRVAGAAVAMAGVLAGAWLVTPLRHHTRTETAALPANYFLRGQYVFLTGSDVSAPPGTLGLAAYDAATGLVSREVAPITLTVGGTPLALSGFDATPVDGYVFLTRNGNEDLPGKSEGALTRLRIATGTEEVLLHSTAVMSSPTANAAGNVVAVSAGTRGPGGAFTYRVELHFLATGKSAVPALATGQPGSQSILGWQGNTLLVGDSAGIHAVTIVDGRVVSSVVVSHAGCPSGEMSGARLGDGRLIVGGSTCDVPGGVNALGLRVLRADGSVDPFVKLGPGSAMALTTTSSGDLRVWTFGDCGPPTLWAFDGRTATKVLSPPACTPTSPR